MELTSFAALITSVFSGFDYSILNVMHMAQQAAGSILNPLAALITLVGEKGAIFLLFAIICLFFKKSRRMGIGIIAAIAICYIIGNICIKDVVCRPRPFDYSDTFHQWWIAAGAYPEDSWSFPSGHVGAAMAAMVVYLLNRRHFSNFVLAVLVVGIMACSRMYLMGHYPSDVLGGIIVGLVAGLIGYAVVQIIWNAVWKKRGGAQALQKAGYRPNRGTEFDIPMGAAKPSRAAGTSPFAAEALNDPMNFTAGGVIGTNYNTQSFHAVPDPAAQTSAFQAYYGNNAASSDPAATTAFQAYYGAQANPQAAANAQAQYATQAQPVYNQQNGGYTTAADNTTDFKNFYDSLSSEPQPSAASTTAFAAYMNGNAQGAQPMAQRQPVQQQYQAPQQYVPGMFEQPIQNQGQYVPGQFEQPTRVAQPVQPIQGEASAFSRDSYGSNKDKKPGHGRHGR